MTAPCGSFARRTLPVRQPLAVCDRDQIIATREEIYDAVLTDPLRKLAKTFEVTDSYLAGVCGSLNIPPPSAGRWAKKDAGAATSHSR